MSEEPTARKRRRRRPRRQGTTSYQPREAPAPTPRPAPAPLPEWNWRTFPVLFAFFVGVVAMGLAVAVPALGLVFFIGGLTGLAFGTAHILMRLWVDRRRR